jgi:hypothetical protein
MSMHCHHARLHIGGEPQALPREVHEHLTTCEQCSRFRDETLGMEGRLRQALELPLQRFRQPTAPVRRFALAASVLLAVLLGGGFWLLRPESALAGEVMEHVIHEPDSWSHQRQLSAAELSAVLQAAGVEFDVTMPVVYAAPCPFRGHRVPHLVVQSSHGPITVMLLAHEKVPSRQEFSEGAYRGVLLPAGRGSVAVITREGQVPEGVTEQVLSGIR